MKASPFFVYVLITFIISVFAGETLDASHSGIVTLTGTPLNFCRRKRWCQRYCLSRTSLVLLAAALGGFDDCASLGAALLRPMTRRNIRAPHGIDMRSRGPSGSCTLDYYISCYFMAAHRFFCSHG
jgi:hypothetical protein